MRDGVYGELLIVCAAYSSHDMTITFGSSSIINVLCSLWICIILTPLILILLNYALALGHGPALKDFFWSSDASVLWAMQWGTGKHWTLYHPELFLQETNKEISPRFSNREQLCFYWKSDLIFYYGPCDSDHGSCVGH